MTTRVRILGCGTSGGIPVIGNRWFDCDPQNPKNRRLRASILVDHGGKKILVDSSPDLRQQLLTAEVDWVDAVLYTHNHADHVHGINDLVTMGRIHRKKIPIYANQETLTDLQNSFSYAFINPLDDYPLYTPYLDPHLISDEMIALGEGCDVKCFEQSHGPSISLGFRFGDFAYSTDTNHLSETAFRALEGVKVWVVDCLQYHVHETHSYLDQTLKWIERVGPEKAYLTHLGGYMDYDALCAKLPPHVRPAYDGLTFDVPLQPVEQDNKG